MIGLGLEILLENNLMKPAEKIVQCQKCLDMATLSLENDKFVSQGKYRYENGEVVHRSNDKICGVCKVIR